MPDEPYDPKKHGDVVKPPPQATASAVASTEEAYDPTKHGEVLSQPDQYGVHDVGQTVSSERAKGPRGLLPFANDVVRNVAEGVSFGTADKLAAFIDSQFGKGSYDELLAKERKETEEAGGRLGPVGTFLAQAGGGMLTGAGLARQGLTLLGKLPASASLAMKMLYGGGEGAAYGALSGFGHTDTGKIDDYVKNTLIGAGTGLATGTAVTGVAGALPRVITPFPSTDPVRAKAMQTLENAGVDVSAGTKTGSPKLRTAEDVISKLPLGGDTTAGKQMAQVTENVMEKAGIRGGGAATPDKVAEGFETVGGTINRLQKYPVKVDDTLLNTVAKVESETKPLVEQGQQGPLQHFIDRITSSQELTPDMAQAIRTQLNEAIKDATGQHQRGLIELKVALDDALARTMQKAGDHAGLETLQAARNQYAHLHILSDALNRSGAAGSRGELTPSALAAALKASVGKVGFTKGEGDLNDLARASAGYLQPPKDSGTATREGYQNPAKWLLGLAGRIGVNNPVAQKILGNQVAPVTVPPSLLQAPVAGAAGVAGADPGPADRIMQGLLMGGP